MGLLDSVLGSLLGGGQSPLQAILASILGGGTGAGAAGGAGGGLGGSLGPLLDRLRQAGLGNQVDSWVGTGENQPLHPEQIRDAFGHQQVEQWSRQSGMGEEDILHQLSGLIPRAVDQATPNGQLPAEGDNPFEGPGQS